MSGSFVPSKKPAMPPKRVGGELLLEKSPAPEPGRNTQRRASDVGAQRRASAQFSQLLSQATSPPQRRSTIQGIRPSQVSASRAKAEGLYVRDVSFGRDLGRSYSEQVGGEDGSAEASDDASDADDDAGSTQVVAVQNPSSLQNMQRRMSIEGPAVKKARLAEEKLLSIEEQLEFAERNANTLKLELLEVKLEETEVAERLETERRVRHAEHAEHESMVDEFEIALAETAQLQEELYSARAVSSSATATASESAKDEDDDAGPEQQAHAAVMGWASASKNLCAALRNLSPGDASLTEGGAAFPLPMLQNREASCDQGGASVEQAHLIREEHLLDEIMTLQQKLAENSGEASDAKSREVELNEALQGTRADLGWVRTSLQEARAENEQLRGAALKTALQSGEIENAATELQDTVRELEKQLIAAEQGRQEALKEHDHLKQSLSQASTFSATHTTKEVHRLEAQLSRMESACSASQAHSTELRAQLQLQQSLADDLEESRSSARQHVHDVRAELLVALQERDALQQRLAQDDNLNALSTDTVELQMELIDKSSKVDDLEAEQLTFWTEATCAEDAARRFLEEFRAGDEVLADTVRERDALQKACIRTSSALSEYEEQAEHKMKKLEASVALPTVNNGMMSPDYLKSPPSQKEVNFTDSVLVAQLQESRMAEREAVNECRLAELKLRNSEEQIRTLSQELQHEQDAVADQLANDMGLSSELLEARSQLEATRSELQAHERGEAPDLEDELAQTRRALSRALMVNEQLRGQIGQHFAHAAHDLDAWGNQVTTAEERSEMLRNRLASLMDEFRGKLVILLTEALGCGVLLQAHHAAIDGVLSEWLSSCGVHAGPRVTVQSLGGSPVSGSFPSDEQEKASPEAKHEIQLLKQQLILQEVLEQQASVELSDVNKSRQELQATLQQMQLEVERERSQRVHFHEEAMRLWSSQKRQQTLMPRLAAEIAITRKTLGEEASEAQALEVAETEALRHSLEEQLLQESVEVCLAKEALDASEKIENRASTAEARMSEELEEALYCNDELEDELSTFLEETREAKQGLAEKGAELLARLGAERMANDQLEEYVEDNMLEAQELESQLAASRMRECELRRELVEARITTRGDLERLLAGSGPPALDASVGKVENSGAALQRDLLINQRSLSQAMYGNDELQKLIDSASADQDSGLVGSQANEEKILSLEKELVSQIGALSVAQGQCGLLKEERDKLAAQLRDSNARGTIEVAALRQELSEAWGQNESLSHEFVTSVLELQEQFRSICHEVDEERCAQLQWAMNVGVSAVDLRVNHVPSPTQVQ